MSTQLIYFSHKESERWDYEQDLILEIVNDIGYKKNRYILNRKFPLETSEGFNILYEELGSYIICKKDVDTNRFYSNRIKKMTTPLLYKFYIVFYIKSDRAGLVDFLKMGKEVSSSKVSIKTNGEYIEFQFCCDTDLSNNDFREIRNDWNYLNKLALNWENFVKDQEYFGIFKIRDSELYA